MNVTFEQVTMQYEEKKVLDELTFTIPDQALVSLLGPSGCGKSTSLMLISGLIQPTSGTILFGTEPVTTWDAVKRKVGMVFQNYALYPHLTVLENIMFPLKMQKMSKKERREKALVYAELVQITDHINKRPKELSGGQQQRVAIARALVKEPAILLMDEPLSNLDARLRIEMREEIRRIQQKTKVTTVFVTHDQAEALSISDHVMVMNQGKIQQFSTPHQLYQEPENQFVAGFLGEPAINFFPATAEIKEQLPEVAVIGIRPENIEVTAKPTEAHFQGEIKIIEQIGRETIVHVQVGQQLVRLIQSGRFNQEVGSSLFLTASPAHLLYFNAAGERLKEGSADLEKKSNLA